LSRGAEGGGGDEKPSAGLEDVDADKS